MCDDIIKYGNQQQDESALVGNEDSLTENKDLKKKRNLNLFYYTDYSSYHNAIHSIDLICIL